MAKAAPVLIGLTMIGTALAWMISAPLTLDQNKLANHEANLLNGKTLFTVGGCASCHAADGAKGEAKLVLSGGHRLDTPFGVFVSPNISPDPETGIGSWSEIDFINAMRFGTSPDGRHYYPAFPYTSYARMPDGDLRDLWAYMQTLPAANRANENHEIGFPFNINRGIGFYKRLYLDQDFVTAENADDQINRGRYLAEGPGHCGECHTPRNLIGGLDESRWMAGAPNPAGKGVVPNLTPHPKGLRDWSEGDIAELLTSGFTPDYDTIGGSMVAVVENTALISEEDRRAMAKYFLSLSELPNGY